MSTGWGEASAEGWGWGAALFIAPSLLELAGTAANSALRRESQGSLNSSASLDLGFLAFVSSKSEVSPLPGETKCGLGPLLRPLCVAAAIIPSHCPHFPPPDPSSQSLSVLTFFLYLSHCLHACHGCTSSSVEVYTVPVWGSVGGLASGCLCAWVSTHVFLEKDYLTCL